MTDKKLDRALQSVGMITFVDCFDKFQNKSPTKNFVSALMNNQHNSYTNNSINVKISNGRLICRMSRGLDALKIIAFASHADKVTISKARMLLAEYDQ